MTDSPWCRTDAAYEDDEEALDRHYEERRRRLAILRRELGMPEGSSFLPDAR